MKSLRVQLGRRGFGTVEADGHELDNVKRLVLEFSVGSLPEITITYVDVSVDVEVGVNEPSLFERKP